MSDRKYRQHGYQDDDRERRPRDGGPGAGDRRPEREPGAPAGTRRMSSEGAKNPRMMGYRAVAKCARCGTPVEGEILSLSKCQKCQTALHAQIQCLHFDPSAPFECAARRSLARVSPKVTAPTSVGCSPRGPAGNVRPASTPAPASPTSNAPESASSAKKAFDDLFNF
ncbi:MAG: hypothetical protein R2708_27335 [Vicinamibacterales bacterium]